jgi:hypothetical protein
LIHIHSPIGCLESTPSLGLLEDFFLFNLCHPDVIELSPFLVEVILDEGVVMATIGIPIMNTNRVKVERGTLHCFVSYLLLLA